MSLIGSSGKYLSTWVLAHLIGFFDGPPIPKLAKLHKVLGLCEVLRGYPMKVVNLAYVLIDGLLYMLLRTNVACDCWFYLIL
jgi:hypothetical protein